MADVYHTGVKVEAKPCADVKVHRVIGLLRDSLEPRGDNRIYVRNIFIGTVESIFPGCKSLLSYDFFLTPLEESRRLVATDFLLADLGEYLKSITLTHPEFAKELWKKIFECTSKGIDIIEAKAYFSSIHYPYPRDVIPQQIYLSEDEEKRIREVVVPAFRSVYGSKAIVRFWGGEHAKVAEWMGYDLIANLPDDLAYFLHDICKISDYHTAVDFSRTITRKVRKISYEALSDFEKKRYKALMFLNSIIANLEGKEAPKLSIYEIPPELPAEIRKKAESAIGACRGNEVMIRRDILGGDLYILIVTDIHEMAHYISGAGDLEKEFLEELERIYTKVLRMFFTKPEVIDELRAIIEGKLEIKTVSEGSSSSSSRSSSSSSTRRVDPLERAITTIIIVILVLVALVIFADVMTRIANAFQRQTVRAG